MVIQERGFSFRLCWCKILCIDYTCVYSKQRVYCVCVLYAYVKYFLGSCFLSLSGNAFVLLICASRALKLEGVCLVLRVLPPFMLIPNQTHFFKEDLGLLAPDFDLLEGQMNKLSAFRDLKKSMRPVFMLALKCKPLHICSVLLNTFPSSLFSNNMRWLCAMVPLSYAQSCGGTACLTTANGPREKPRWTAFCKGTDEDDAGRVQTAELGVNVSAHEFAEQVEI